MNAKKNDKTLVDSKKAPNLGELPDMVTFPLGEPCWLLHTYRGGKNLDSMLKQRKITKSYVSLTGKLQSLKQEIASHFESPLEQDFLKILEFDWSVVSFVDQPVTISYRGSDNKNHHYTPDVLVHYSSKGAPIVAPRSKLIEIKTKKDLKNSQGKYNERFKAAEAYASERGWDFVVLTEDDIRTPYLENAIFLVPFRSYEILRPEYGVLLACLRKQGGKSIISRLISEATLEIKKGKKEVRKLNVADDQLHGRLMAMTWHLLAEGIFKADFTRERVSLASTIWKNGTTPS